jgi:serine/threonine protein kinase
MDVCFCLKFLPCTFYCIDLVKFRLGGGGTGKVFVVDKVSTKKKMVLKLLRLGVRGTEEFNKNSKAMEAEILVEIKLVSLSKYLVQLTEFFVEEEYCCLIMEFCTVRDLEKIFNEKNQDSQPVSFFILKFTKFLLLRSLRK